MNYQFSKFAVCLSGEADAALVGKLLNSTDQARDPTSKPRRSTANHASAPARVAE
jgi:hypothetical protein